MRSGLLICLLAATGAEAQQSRENAPLSGPECFCTDRAGARVELGQTICLMVDGRAFLARCEMSLNVPAWRDTGSDCVGAGPVATPWRTPSLGGGDMGKKR